ncbi:type I pullulanase [Alloscardovia criceti]|uniref:type I pullulanase n=1 Tax=Alloscardovia criceti TaxID=356828 RepID=UPI0003A6A107|nr:type I pullulanase [Alloscardovia criceti]
MSLGTVVVHYHMAQPNYSDRSVWMWQDGQEGENFKLVDQDSFGCYTSVSVQVGSSTETHEFTNFLVRNADFSYKTCEYRVQLRNDGDDTHVWLVEGDNTLYYSWQAAIASAGYAQRDPHAYDMAIHSELFDKRWGYSGWLGYRYSQEFTEFRLWAPTAQKVDLVLYTDISNSSPIKRSIPMLRGTVHDEEDHSKNTHGVWFLRLNGDINGTVYAFAVHHKNGQVKYSVDPYARAIIGDGARSVVLSPHALSPDGFTVKHGEEAFWRTDNPSSSVVCEMHIRDFTISHTSGVPRQLRGTYKGACTSGTTNTYGSSTGIDYIQDQGYSYIQLQPVADYHKFYNSSGEQRYNWGYDPQNYNVPEPSYSSNPNNPVTPIHELKRMIQKYHERGIGVILDVVYNHTYSSLTHSFQLTVPDYYYRMNPDGSFADGSGCGNETASEKEMCRKYIIDSVMYWASEYGVDGFRFDLMGLHDVDTMNALRARLDELDPHILMYGEGWDMGVHIAADKKAKKDNAALTPRIGYFNDTVRDGVKGAEVYGYIKGGFVSNEAGEGIIAKGLLGSSELTSFTSPHQVVNYIEAHDNYNLNDLLNRLQPEDEELTHIQRVELANGLNLVMQGMCFMQIGQEFLRTKLRSSSGDGEITLGDRLRAMNSYNAPDSVNRVNWDNVTTYIDTVSFVRRLIELKTSGDMFSFDNYDDVREHVFVWSALENSGIIGFDISTDAKKYRIVATTQDIPVNNVLSDFPNAHVLVSNNSLNGDKDKMIDAYSLVIFEQLD